MEDILASIKKVIAEEKELRVSPPPTVADEEADDVLELDQLMEAPADLAPPLLDSGIAGETRKSFEELSSVAAAIPPPPATHPLEDMIRDMLKPILKQWVDEHLPQIVNDQVRREISRITGKPL